MEEEETVVSTRTSWKLEQQMTWQHWKAELKVLTEGEVPKENKGHSRSPLKF